MGDRGERKIVLRRATPGDSQFLWECRNDDGARRASFSQDPIPFNTHAEWYARALEDPARLILIAEVREAGRVGYVRFSFNDREAEINIAVNSRLRGKGYGTEMISSACGHVFRAGLAQRIRARIRSENEQSVRAFSASGFKLAASGRLADGGAYVEMSLECPGQTSTKPSTQDRSHAR